MMLLVHVPAGDLTEIHWSEPAFMPLIEHIADLMKCDRLEIIRQIIEHETQLHIVSDEKRLRAVILTQLLLRHGGDGTNCRVMAIAGDDMAGWLHLLPDLEAWAKAQGCKIMEPLARPGWRKLLKPYGYRMTHVLLEKELN
jgi:hypothetical protein